MSEQWRDDYLWDRTGDPDEELRELERLLEVYRYVAVADAGGTEETEETDVHGATE